MNPLYLNIGALAIVFIFAIKEYFSLQKAKRNGNGGLTSQVKLIGDNHLEHIYTEMKEQTRQHGRMIEILTQINTKLDK